MRVDWKRAVTCTMWFSRMYEFPVSQKNSVKSQSLSHLAINTSLMNRLSLHLYYQPCSRAFLHDGAQVYLMVHLEALKNQKFQLTSDSW